MPKLKSAVNSFLLTKTRLKRRKTNKRKGKTNRRYKRWMRGGAFDSLGPPSEDNLNDAIKEINDILIDETKLSNLNTFLDKFQEDNIKVFVEKENTNKKIMDIIVKLNEGDKNDVNISRAITLFGGISKILATLIEEETKKLSQSGSNPTPPPLGAKAGPNAASEPQGPATKLIIQHGEPPNVKETIYILEKPIFSTIFLNSI